MFNRLLASFCLLLLLFGCSATGTKFRELVPAKLNGMSEIIIYHESKIVASGSSFCTKVNGESIGTLENGGYLRAEVGPGNQNISMPFSKELSVKFESKPDQTRYIEFTVGLSGLRILPIGTIIAVSTSWNMALVVTDEAYSKGELSGLRESTRSSDCEK